MVRRRFVLRYRGEGPKPKADIERVRRTNGATVIDETRRMMLVEADEEAIDALAGALSDWIVAPEGEMALPERPDSS